LFVGALLHVSYAEVVARLYVSWKDDERLPQVWNRLFGRPSLSGFGGPQEFLASGGGRRMQEAMDRDGSRNRKCTRGSREPENDSIDMAIYRDELALEDRFSEIGHCDLILPRCHTP
jgi:hypothetical protein